MIRYLLVMVPIAFAAPRFLGGGAVKMYALESVFVLAMGIVAWRR